MGKTEKLIKPQFLTEASTELKKVKKGSVRIVNYYNQMGEELTQIRKLSGSKEKIKDGQWVYYPWSKSLVKILSKDDYYDLRTARNKYINKPEEQDRFRNFVVGIAGLSVGNSIALALTYGGGAETIKLADPDVLDGSNLNRIRAATANLGENKALIAAKQIYEVNPYANIILYPEGLNGKNLKDFLLGPPKLDLIVEEMDDLKMKIFMRLAARATRIPLVMATDNADNAIIDVDRFDLDPNPPPFNELPKMGLETVVKGIDFGEPLDLNILDRVRFATNMVGPANASSRMQDSLMKVGTELVSWPQPATSVFTGGSALAYVIKKLAFGEKVKSGKTHLSLDKHFLEGFDSRPAQKNRKEKTERFTKYIEDLSLKPQENYSVWSTKESDFPKNSATNEKLKFLLNYAVMAPSSHNTQPWKFKTSGKQIDLFFDETKRLKVSDPTNREALISLGAAVANLSVAANHFGLSANVKYFPKGERNDLVASINFNEESEGDAKLARLFPAISKRLSNRSRYSNKPIPNKIISEIQNLNTDPNIKIHMILDDKTKEKISDLVGKGTKLMMKSRDFRAELSDWLRHNFTKHFDGMPGNTLGLNDIQSMTGPFLIHYFDIGEQQSKIDKNVVLNSPLLVCLSSKYDKPDSWVKVGELYEKTTLLTTLYGIDNATLAAVVELEDLPTKLSKVLKTSNRPQVFFRLGFSTKRAAHSPRKNVEKVLLN